MTSNIKLAIIGDLHYAVRRGSSDPYLEVEGGRKLLAHSATLLKATIEAVNAEPDVAAAVILGDLTRDSEDFNHLAVKAELASLKVPFYIALGNHDLYRTRPEGTMYPDCRRLDRDDVTELYRDFGLPDGAPWYFVDLAAQVRLIVLDSTLSHAELESQGLPLALQDHGFIGEAQLAWLETVLSEAAGASLTPVVVSHHTVMDQSPAESPGHPLSSIFAYWQVRDAVQLRELLERYDVRLVLSGHLHAQSVNTHGKLYNVVTAAVCSYPHYWRTLELTDTSIELQTRSIADYIEDKALFATSSDLMGEGMGEVVRERVQAIPLMRAAAPALERMIVESRWWQRFSDGTLPGFSVPRELRVSGNPLISPVLQQAATMLDGYGTWKAERPDPGDISIPLL